MTVLITGASKGIGKDLAYEFAKNNNDLILIARSRELLEKLKIDIENKFPVKVSIYDLDLTNKNSLDAFLNNFQEEVNILINNAGFGDFSFFHEAELEKLLNMVDLNIKALVQLSHFFAKRFVEKGSGKILNIASTAAFCPGPMMATYFATKAFVLSFSEALNCELENKGVLVSCLCPGPTHSDFSKTANVENSLAFKYAMEGSEVAKIAYKQLITNQAVTIAGTRNKILIFARKFMPGKLIAKINQAILSRSN
jgi:short-subunit dehydrogenase